MFPTRTGAAEFRGPKKKKNIYHADDNNETS